MSATDESSTPPAETPPTPPAETPPPPAAPPPPPARRERPTIELLGRRAPAWTAGLAVLAVAAALRLALVRDARFTGDEAFFYVVARAAGSFRPLPILGPPMSGGEARHPGPAFYAVIAAPQFFTRAPEACNALVALLGAASVLLFWAALRKPFGERPAAVAALLLACSPWSALYADRAWNSNVVGFPIAIALWCALRVREDPRSRWVAMLLFACAVMPQFHMSAPIVWLALAPFVVGTVRRWNRRWVLVGVAASVVVYLPFIAHEAATGLANTKAYLAESRAAARHPTHWLYVPRYVARLVTLDVTYHELRGYWGGLDEDRAVRALFRPARFRPYPLARNVALVASGVLAAAALVVAAATAALRARREGLRRAVGPFGLAAVVAVAADMALMRASGKQIFAHYVQPVIPFLFVGFAALFRAADARAWSRWLTLAVVAVVCAGGVEATLSVTRYVHAPFGLRVQRAALDAALEDGAREGTPPDAPVRVECTYYVMDYMIAALARHAYAGAIVHDQRNGYGRRYRVQLPHEPPPPDRHRVTPPRDVGGRAVVWRIR